MVRGSYCWATDLGRMTISSVFLSFRLNMLRCIQEHTMATHDSFLLMASAPLVLSRRLSSRQSWVSSAKITFTSKDIKDLYQFPRCKLSELWSQEAWLSSNFSLCLFLLLYRSIFFYLLLSFSCPVFSRHDQRTFCIFYTDALLFQGFFLPTLSRASWLVILSVYGIIIVVGPAQNRRCYGCGGLCPK